ncbi:MAG: hypothetical protein B7Z60_01220 [Ferrovum sp. 37-45-19]|jgi:hypothetical protein|uniref:DUF2080 family transposase-associated protein n=1 Tax=Ferrovum sp. JA12 TaxID=1356299 RepID=UPI00071371E8|nr:DUF2080 family transposase-associated protein [Ferrovum sp. JA12]OYV80637.1 MAG: hypothetical protein B7Z65_00105 [Ferrovum sp. 21-44-67]OYV95188.1 MAG: hypothetical protein B7Z60_01220 [Ferrovum sp. 37-45-19]OZB33787.1 MAG: hypothetical protein B7X47_03460 [Ferrovum sp. 34-44-207]HQT80685.1 DUF2080 family transposase-associated protein [Ferrovaceae bacterium]KRH79777.1 hypothetical protein FERRO_08530 [Ferrovum sp. JA12]
MPNENRIKSKPVFKREFYRYSSLDYQVVKSIGTSGQISLGKEHAGKKVLIENLEPGVRVICTVTIIPDNERWLHEPAAAKKGIGKALAWAFKNPAKESNFADLKIKKAQSVKRKEHSA